MSRELQGAGIDHEIALARVGGDSELLREIAGLFLDDYPKVLVELRSATDRGDAKALERTAHGLKGSVANFGAKAAVDAAFRIESMGRERTLTDVPRVLQALEFALAELRPELEAL